MMLLTEYRIRDFVDELASKSPAPGGGSASAFVGALGVALVSMVANLTSGKERFRDRGPLLQKVLLEAEKIKDSLLSLVDRDTKAFNRVAEVFKMPRETEEQKRVRSEAMEHALKEATLIPLAIMEECFKAIRLHEKALGNTAPSTLSDLGVGVLCLKAALCGGWLNVKINLNSIKDRGFVEDTEKKARAILEHGIQLAERIYQKVEEELAQRKEP